jgi:hypothetical protein
MDLTSIPLDAVLGVTGPEMTFDLAAVVQSVIAGGIGLFVASMKRNLSAIDATMMNLAIDVKALGKTDTDLALSVRELQIRVRAAEERCNREHDRRGSGEHEVIR